MTDDDSLGARVQAWVDDDPDPVTAQELTSLLAAADEGDLEASIDLADRFAGMLEFGTAGLRGALGGGPNRMNRAVVLRAAAGLVAYLQTECGIPEPMVVVGFDARYNSDVFARDTAAVVVGAGGRAAILPRPLPTPVLAFAIRHLGADAGVMVTASHNPPQDNGYKVYLGDGSQIVPPTDAQIASHIAAVASVRDLYLVDDGWETLGDEVQDAYVERVAALVPAEAPRDLSVVHTSLHGVGDDTVRRVFAAAGFSEPITVATQAEPDPDFPTVSFPNPEEAGAIDAALAVAREVRPDIVIANDPDADRCAAAVLDADGWRMLRGDELGALLGAHVIEPWCRARRRVRVLHCVVPSPRRDGRCERHAARGDAHRVQVDQPGPRAGVRVRGGAGLLRGPADRPRQGRCERGPAPRRAGCGTPRAWPEPPGRPRHHRREPRRLRDRRVLGPRRGPRPDLPRDGAAAVGPAPRARRGSVSRVDDLARGDGGLPPTDGVRWFLADDSRVIVRPSGTEPKIKVYLEAVEPVAGADQLAAARETAAERLAAMRAAMESLTRI